MIILKKKLKGRKLFKLSLNSAVKELGNDEDVDVKYFALKFKFMF